MDAITLSAGVRFDRSTNNGDYKKYFVLPKASASWNPAKMGFWSINDINSKAARGLRPGGQCSALWREVPCAHCQQYRRAARFFSRFTVPATRTLNRNARQNLKQGST